MWCFLIPVTIHATHNRAGEITYRQIGPQTIEVTITTYTKASSTAADRDSLNVNWGDGTTEMIHRDNSRTRFEPNDIKINFYVAQHTYPGVATYMISFLDPNRISGILNVNYPNSIDIPFFLSTTFTLLDQQFQGYNNSAVLLQPPIDIGCVHKIFIHNPNAYDPDGDSLAYELTTPLQDLNSPVPGYRFPNEVGTVSGNDLSIDPVTGEIRWDSPKLQGEYNIAIKIKEYRNGRLINVILRDMQIFIKACDNDPPSIESIDEVCVVAGTSIEIPVRVNDPNRNQKVRLSATGGPFSVNDPAVLSAPAFFTNVPYDAKLIWKTTCNHISNQYYQIVLRAVDNFYADSTGLATLKTIRIKVIGPAPEQLTTAATPQGIRLEWQMPYSCEITENNFFQGFSVWRKETSSTIQPDTCNPGLSGGPYQKIVFKTNASENGHFFYLDTNVEKGKTYCYRVLAEFAKLSATGNPFNKIESLPSNESCMILRRDAPLIIRVSVEHTDERDGQMLVKWTRPLPDQLDTILHHGTYNYSILRSEDNATFSQITEQSLPYFGSLPDTVFTDNTLNTEGLQYFYKVRLTTGDKSIFESQPASSVYLQVQPSDRQNNLKWNAHVPWSNYSYDIFRKAAGEIDFRYLTTVKSNQYSDKNLSNASEYCYKVQSSGSYSINGIEDPLLNFSQEVCKRPVDDIPPCPVSIHVVNICDRPESDINPDNLYNTISWNHPSDECPEAADDVAGYILYYTASNGNAPKKIQVIENEHTLTYTHYPELGISGCYAVSSFDKSGNESALSPIICVDSCPLYELPNTFTPNGDGHNDLFRPVKNLFIAGVEFKVYNQWGNLVFETTDPEINWDGKTSGNKILADGTYYYSCIIYENRVQGVIATEKPLSGFIHILRN